jgi:hypothetical protein
MVAPKFAFLRQVMTGIAGLFTYLSRAPHAEHASVLRHFIIYLWSRKLLYVV